MGFADSFLIGAALLIGVPLVLGILVRLGGRWLPGWVPPAVVIGSAVAIALALSLWLDRSGATTTGIVVRKDETLWGSRAGRYVHHLSMWVRLHPSGMRDSVLTEVGADLAEFDTLRAGGPVRIRYLPAHPSFARLAGRTTLDVVRGVIPPGGEGIAWAALAVAVVVLSWVVLGRSRVGRAVAVSLTLVALAVGLVAIFTMRPPPALRPPVRTTMGRVAWIDRITTYDVGGRHTRPTRLPAPYDVVGVRLLATGGRDSVLGADAVDTGSIRGLRLGTPVSVRYAARDPREVEIAGATRTFYARDNSTIVYMLAALAVIAGLWIAVRAALRHAAARLRRDLEQARRAAGGPSPPPGSTGLGA